MKDLLESLKAKYIEELPDKINEMKLFFEKKDWSELQNAFHKLKGSGKTYGLPEVSDISERCETYLIKKCSLSPNRIENPPIDSLQDLTSAFSPELFSQIFKLYDEIYHSRTQGKSLDLSQHPIFEILNKRMSTNGQI